MESRWRRHTIGPPDSGRSWTSAMGRGRVKTEIPSERNLCTYGFAAPFALAGRTCRSVSQQDRACYPVMAALRGFTPMMRMVRFRLYASTCKLISVLTFGNVFIRKCVAPIHALSVPKTCSTVCRRRVMAFGVRSSRSCMASRTDSCSQREIRR